MINSNQRLKKLARHIKGDHNEEITITLGNNVITFKNAEEIRLRWIDAVLDAHNNDNIIKIKDKI